MRKSQPLVDLVQSLNEHEVENPDDHSYLTDPEFLRLTDEGTAELVEAIDANARELLSNGDGTLDRRALTNLRKAGVDAREAGTREDPTFVAVSIKCEHGEIVVPL